MAGTRLINGSGSLVPLIQCNKNSCTANVQSPSSLSEFPSFKSYLASLELSPVKSYQIFYFVNFRLDGRPCLLQTDMKTPPWAFCISPVCSSMKWEMWTSHIRWQKRIKRMKMSRALVEHWWYQNRTSVLLAYHQKPLALDCYDILS